MTTRHATEAYVDAAVAGAGAGLTTEQVQDVVGGMFSGNTETGIAATYDDTNGKIDLDVTGGGGGAFVPLPDPVVDIPDTTGATLAALETRLNDISAVLRSIGVLAPPTPPPYDPRDVAGLIGAWQPDELSGLANADPVSTYLALVGANLTQSGGNRPTYRTNVLNGRPVVRFDKPSSQWLQGGSVTAKHWIVVAKYDAATFAEFDALITGDASEAAPLIGFQGDSIFYDGLGMSGGTYHLNGVPHATATAPGPMNAWGIISLSKSAGWTIVMQLGRDRDFPARTWKGDIADVLAFDHVLSSSDLNFIGNGLADKYALSWTDV